MVQWLGFVSVVMNLRVPVTSWMILFFQQNDYALSVWAGAWLNELSATERECERVDSAVEGQYYLHVTHLYCIPCTYTILAYLTTVLLR
jgi:hypothetical protein